LTGGLPSLEPIKGVSPIYELWSPRDGSIDGVFTVAWLRDGNESAAEIATAYSEYQPVRMDLLAAKPKHRFIRLDSAIDSCGRLHVTQRSNLVDQVHIPY
jgi:hypothetical protein